MIGRRHHLVIDAMDPRSVADFWSAVLGDPVTYDDGDFVVVAKNDQTSGLAFQRASPDNPLPTWPENRVPQQMHMDVMVDDVAAAGTAVLALGARHIRGTVYADPAGHPFCLVPRPGWAAPIGPGTS